MALNLKTSHIGNRIKEWIKLVTFEQNRPAALGADDQVLVTVPCPDESLAAFGLVDTLNQTQLLEFFEGAINADQPQPGANLARRVKHFNRGEGARTP